MHGGGSDLNSSSQSGDFEKKKEKKRIKPGLGAAKSHVKGSVPASRRRHLHKWRHTADKLHLGCVHLCVCSVFAKEEGSSSFNYATVKTLRAHCEPIADPDALLRGSSSKEEAGAGPAINSLVVARTQCTWLRQRVTVTR